MDKQIESIFEDADNLYREAVRELQEGHVRNAAEKAWGATARATSGLILARTGRELDGTRGMTSAFVDLMRQDDRLRRLEGRYFTRESFLHGYCFYMGVCEPRDEIDRRIRETDQYIRDCRELAGG